MNKNILLILFYSFCISTIHGQVGINTVDPEQSSMLDINSSKRGFLLPRMNTNQKKSIIKPAKGLMVYDTTENCISYNEGIPENPSWVCSYSNNKTQFFYMPSITIDASTKGSGRTINLYDECKAQYGSPMKVSKGAPNAIPNFPERSQLYYYVTYYDENVLSITKIDTDGLMTYDVIDEAKFKSYMNVVFVIVE